MTAVKTYTIVFKREASKLESIRFTCLETELAGLLEYCEIYENNILSICELN